MEEQHNFLRSLLSNPERSGAILSFLSVFGDFLACAVLRISCLCRGGEPPVVQTIGSAKAKHMKPQYNLLLLVAVQASK